MTAENGLRRFTGAMQRLIDVVLSVRRTRADHLPALPHVISVHNRSHAYFALPGLHKVVTTSG